MTILELPDGLHEDVPEATYHQRIPGVASKSALELVARSPAHYAAWLAGAEREETEALAFGKALHCSLLEPAVYERRYVVAPAFGDCRKKENKALRDAWRKENEGRVPLEKSDALAILGMNDSVMAHPLAGKMLEEGRSELTMKWTDAETGIICKGRSDRYVERLGLCLDVKTTEDARPGPFAKSVANYGYFKQAAFYTDGFAAVGAPLHYFAFVCVEKSPPYAVAVYALDAEAIEQGRKWTRRALNTLADCIERGEYPGYETTIKTLSLPNWAKDAA